MICKIMLVHDRNWDVFFFFFPKALMLLIRNLLVHTFILFIISYSYPWNYFSVRALGRLLEIPIVYPALVFDFVWVPVLHYKCYMLCRWCLSMTHRPFSIWGSLSIKYKCAHIPDVIIPNYDQRRRCLFSQLIPAFHRVCLICQFSIFAPFEPPSPHMW